MHAWYREQWEFEITVLAVGKKNRPEECRLGLEQGDRFQSTYGCPSGLCPKTMMKAFPLTEAVRSGGDLRALGGDTALSLDFICPDAVVRFRLVARKLDEA
jgi:uncharacterized repeat protein (TIGR04076 family)